MLVKMFCLMTNQLQWMQLDESTCSQRHENSVLRFVQLQIDNVVVARVKLFSRFTSNSTHLIKNRTFVMLRHIGSFKHLLCPLQWLMKLSVTSSKQENTRNLLSIMDVGSSSLQSAGALTQQLSRLILVFIYFSIVLYIFV